MNETIRSDAADWSTSPLDREIVVTRVVNADRTAVCQAWTDHDQIVKWFGPEGFTCKTHEIDIRTGGVWRFDMIAPDGTCFSNKMDFLRVDSPRVIEALHGKDADEDPHRFRLLVTFDEQDDGKTVVTLRQIHPTPERRKVVVGFGAVELGGQTLSKLAAHVERF
ncbi:SRPBCC family protein [Sphingorhabdus contaminans]|uniref:SRPBCC family protein n=1 Tax=Sphingorhabdus contaminans TaxID=1343899 RepID=UPI003D2B0D7F